MLGWIKSLFNLTSSEQLAEIERREPSLEERLERLLRRLGHYNGRRADELEEIMADLETVLDIVEKIIAAMEHLGGAERARELRKRLRNNRTRALKAYQALAAAGQ